MTDYNNEKGYDDKKYYDMDGNLLIHKHDDTFVWDGRIRESINGLKTLYAAEGMEVRNNGSSYKNGVCLIPYCGSIIYECDRVYKSPVTWRVENKEIAKVTKNGRIYGIKAGKTNVIAKLDWSGQEIKIPLVVEKNSVAGGARYEPEGEARFTMKYNKTGDLVYELCVNNKMNKKAYVKYRNLTFGINDKENGVKVIIKKKPFKKWKKITVKAKSKKTIVIAKIKKSKLKGHKYDIAHLTSMHYPYRYNKSKNPLQVGVVADTSFGSYRCFLENKRGSWHIGKW